jgi:hypothetical protein
VGPTYEVGHTETNIQTDREVDSSFSSHNSNTHRHVSENQNEKVERRTNHMHVDGSSGPKVEDLQPLSPGYSERVKILKSERKERKDRKERKKGRKEERGRG